MKQTFTFLGPDDKEILTISFPVPKDKDGFFIPVALKSKTILEAGDE